MQFNGLINCKGEFLQCAVTALYLFLCQASVADPSIPGRTDDGTAWKKRTMS